MSLEKAKQQIHPSWYPFLLPEFEKEYMQNLKTFLQEEKKNSKVVYPPSNQVFKALEVPLNDVQGVLLGQDPYHGPGQAMGYSFSVPSGTKVPPSLRRIYKELAESVDFVPPQNGDLSVWSKRNGLLLLNSVLTVRQGQPGSHAKKGWESFTDVILQTVNDQTSHTIFLLLGNYAKNKGSFLSRDKHCVLEAAHPSPLARQGFIGSRIFAKANEYRIQHGLPAIDWQI